MWLLLIVLVCGALTTYLWDEEMPVSARIAVGTPVGIAAFSLMTLAFAFPLGLAGGVLLALGVYSVSLGIALRRRGEILKRDVACLRMSPRQFRFGPYLYYGLLFLLFWRFFARVLWETPQGIYTGVWDNFADVAYHLGFAESFARGDNFPPTHPMYAGTRLTYPFLADFFSACLMRMGANRSDAFFYANVVFSLTLVGLLQRITLQWTRDRKAGYIAPLLVVFGGGLGFLLLLPEAREGGGLLHLLGALPHHYTQWENTLWWGNPFVYWFATMRGMLLGAPLMLVVWSLLWTGATRRKPSTFVAAGILTGLLPLAHTHSFLCTFGFGIAVAVLFRMGWAGLRFAALAILLAVPQLLLLFIGSATRTGTFFGISLGWMAPEADEKNGWVFWLMNAGLFPPMLLVALLWRRRGRWLIPDRARRFYLPFLLCFIFPNLVKFAPWAWDSVKVLYVWFLASVPLVALFVARLWRSRTPGSQAVGITLFLLLTLSGVLDMWRVSSGQMELEVFMLREVRFSEQIAHHTEPKAVILGSPSHNSPVMLAGRRMFMSYPGFLWTNGLPYEEREQAMRTLYQGGAESLALLHRYGIQYVIVGQQEREWAKDKQVPLNETYFKGYLRVDDGSVPECCLYRVP